MDSERWTCPSIHLFLLYVTSVSELNPRNYKKRTLSIPRKRKPSNRRVKVNTTTAMTIIY